LPIFLLIPIAIIFFRQERITQFFKYLVITFATFACHQSPRCTYYPERWWRFYVLNLNRGSDWGSIWYALSNLGLDLTHQNYLSVLCLLIGLTSLIIFLLQLRTIPTLAHTALFVMIIVMAVSKVYSPQYVLWLTPLAVIALIDKRELTVFWFWQGAEVAYHLAIWQHLAQVTGAKFGLPSCGVLGHYRGPNRGLHPLAGPLSRPPSEFPRISRRISLIYKRELPLTSS
jgi:uncharacterized membrane protein